MAGRMRGIAAVAMVGVAVLAGAAPVSARPRTLDAGISVTGSVTVAWQGDPARGCAAAGLCGYRGSVALRPADTSQVELTFDHRVLVDGYGSLSTGDSPVIRVTRDEGDGTTTGGCVDLARSDQVDLGLVSSGRGRVLVRFAAFGLSPRRCAGPVIANALDRLPAGTLSLARLQRGGAVVDLAGRARFGAGPFSALVVSTLRMRIGRPHAQQQIPPELLPPQGQRRPATRRVRVATVHARYRISSLLGSITVPFQGLPEPGCVPLDACGVTGTASFGIIAHDGWVVVDGGALVRRSDRGLRGLIAALERGDGEVTAYGILPHASGTTTVDVQRTGGAPCRDSARLRAPLISSRFVRRRLALEVGADTGEPVADLVRAGCPGPTLEDVSGTQPLARASLPLAALARRRLEVVLLGDGPFGGSGYSGTRHARFTFELRRLRIKVSYGTQPVPR
jgi:hypothetical protein